MKSLREKIQIKTYDADTHGNLKLYSLMNYFQEAASRNAEELHFGFDDLTNINVFWVLSRMQVHVHRLPKWNEELWLETWPMKLDKLFALRGFEVRNAENELMIEAVSAWLMIDIDSRRPKRPSDIMPKTGWMDHKGNMYATPGKISCPEDLEFDSKLKVKYSDIDVNKHVANSKYVEWAVDPLAVQMDVSVIKVYQINFLKEAKLGDEIELHTGKEDNKYFVVGINAETQQKHFEMVVG
jgi:acyl-ACP thioesterase